MSETVNKVTALDVGKALFAAEKRVLTPNEGSILVKLTIADIIGAPVEYSEMENIPFPVKVFWERAKSHGIPVTFGSALLMGAVSPNVGSVVMYVAAAKAIYEDTKKIVNFLDLVGENYFGDGFPTDAELERIWDMQKVFDGQRPDNWLDRDVWS
jgi:hypothetical protein